MPRRNRIDPWGDLHAVSGGGLLTGNRGCLVDDRGRMARHHRGPLWITCLLAYQGWRHPLDQTRDMDTDLLPRRRGRTGRGAPSLWPLPTNGLPRLSGCRLPGRWIVRPPGAGDLNRRLARERLRAGTRARPWPRSNTDPERIDRLPPGAVIVDHDHIPETGVGGSSAPIQLSPDGPSHDHGRGPAWSQC